MEIVFPGTEPIPAPSPPPAESEVQGWDKKQKRLEDLTYSGTSKPKDVLQEKTTSKDPPPTMFDLLDL
jgi:hypothetical protein